MRLQSGSAFRAHRQTRTIVSVCSAKNACNQTRTAMLHRRPTAGPGKRRMLRAFRQLAADLITFLAQIEDVQLRLFEKRKFIISFWHQTVVESMRSYSA